MLKANRTAVKNLHIVIHQAFIAPEDAHDFDIMIRRCTDNRPETGIYAGAIPRQDSDTFYFHITLFFYFVKK